MRKQFNTEASFIDGSRGSLFAIHFPPQNNKPLEECIVIVPAFAEEMNRCRYMQTMLSQAITPHGCGLLSVDLYGTGDSAGEFVEASWQQWLQDTMTAIDHAHSLGYIKVSLLAVRLGALLAVEAVASTLKINRLIFWQPIINGKTALNQFLRIKIAASIGRDEDGGSTAQFEEQIRQGNSLQVAGYDVSPELFQGINSARMENHLALIKTPVIWFTLLASEDRKTPRGDRVLIDKWRNNGAEICHKTVIGAPFWQAHERTLVPDLIAATAKSILGENA